MSTKGIAAYLLIAGFVLVLIASFVGPNAVYTAPDSQTRLEIIEQNKVRWITTNLTWVAASLVTAVGFLLLTLALRESQSPWLLYAGSIGVIVGLLAWSIFLYQRIVDPAGNLYTTPPAPMSIVFAWAMIVGLVLYGIAFLQGGYPNWLGYTLLIAMGLLTGGLIFFFDVVYALFPPQFFNLLALVIGIATLRQ